jgi:ubiquinone/menaquinone biosynthesis C-methylase UbiE
MKKTHVIAGAMATAALLSAGPIAAQDHAEHEHGDHEMQHSTAQHRFEDAERWAESFDAEERDSWQKPEEVVALMAIDPGMSVVDLGAGTGYFLGPLARAVGADGVAVGLDIEPDMVEYMRERAEREGWHNVEARVVAPDDPQLAPASVDRVLVVNVWHHIEGREAYARKLRKGLEPGGEVWIVDFTKESSHGPPVHHRLDPEEVMTELEAGGLETRLVEDETLPEQYVVVGRRSP